MSPDYIDTPDILPQTPHWAFLSNKMAYSVYRRLVMQIPNKCLIPCFFHKYLMLLKSQWIGTYCLLLNIFLSLQ